MGEVLMSMTEEQEGRNNFNKGMRGLFGCLTGRRKQIEERNELDGGKSKCANSRNATH